MPYGAARPTISATTLFRPMRDAPVEETTFGRMEAIEAHAASRNITLCQMSVMALTSASMSVSLCRGVGVNRSRSVPRGTVG